MKWYLKVMKHYSDFNGRASREEYWMFVLFNFLISLLFFLIDILLGTMNNILFVGILSSFYSIGVMVPSWAVTVRRLHDVGKSGFFILIEFVPIIGSFWLLLTLIKNGDEGSNIYGENPNNYEIITENDYA